MAIDREPLPRTSVAMFWLVVALLLGLALALVSWRERPPPPRPASIPTTAFSAERAWPVLAYLADTIGHRVVGTPGADRAVAYLTRALRRIPGVEVQVQTYDGAWQRRPSLVMLYTVKNVLVRIPGSSRDAVLLSAHYDSPPESVGAGDDGVATAALVEIVRAIAVGPKLANTVIVNINDGEEAGLLGSRGFTHHPWIRDVKAFVNLESAGPHGKAILFQSGPGNPWLAGAYARSVPFPYGSVIAQDIFQSGAIPSDTDFRIYRDLAGLRGLDIAFYREGYAYHTQRDRTWNVPRGAMQHMGENALALTRELGSRALPGNASGERAVYYDVLGAFMFSYGEHTARLLALLASGLGSAAVIVALRRRAVSVRGVAIGFASAIATAVVAPIAATGAAIIGAYAVRRPMSWFAEPAAGVAAFALIALASALLLHHVVARILRRRGSTPVERGHMVWAGALVLGVLVLVALTLWHVGAAYVVLWWVVGGAVGLLASLLLSRRWWWLGPLVGAAPGALLTLQLATMFIALFVPVFGRLIPPFAPDAALALMVATPTIVIALAILPPAHRAGGLGTVGAVALAAGIVALVLSLGRFPYTPRRPQRLALVHEHDERGGTLRVYGADYNTPERALAHVEEMRPVPARPARRYAFERAAGPTTLPDPTLVVVRRSEGAMTGARTLELRVSASGAFRLRLRLPARRIAAWSIPTTLPTPARTDSVLVLDYVAPPDTGWHFSLRVRGEEPLPITVEAVRATATPSAADVMRRLPPWTDVYALAVNRREFRL
jgi:hypothetical protein